MKALKRDSNDSDLKGPSKEAESNNEDFLSIRDPEMYTPIIYSKQYRSGLETPTWLLCLALAGEQRESRILDPPDPKWTFFHSLGLVHDLCS